MRRLRSASARLDRFLLGARPFEGPAALIRAWVALAAVASLGIVAYGLLIYGDVESWTDLVIYVSYFATIAVFFNWRRHKRSSESRF